ncbi:MAG: hypothetical protein PUP91_21770 [Rhizonema sp. PD37]|nr:hypothetical protein [Rhizonema sp. PD37]
MSVRNCPNESKLQRYPALSNPKAQSLGERVLSPQSFAAMVFTDILSLIKMSVRFSSVG